MYSVIFTSLGLILWSASLAIAKYLGHETVLARKQTTKIFILLWLIISIANFVIKLRDGHSLDEEIAFLVMIFAIPSIVAFTVNKRLG